MRMEQSRALKCCNCGAGLACGFDATLAKCEFCGSGLRVGLGNESTVVSAKSRFSAVHWAVVAAAIVFLPLLIFGVISLLPSSVPFDGAEAIFLRSEVIVRPNEHGQEITFQRHFYKYFHNGIEYEAYFDYEVSVDTPVVPEPVQPGDRFEIFINPNNPNNFRWQSSGSQSSQSSPSIIMPR